MTRKKPKAFADDHALKRMCEVILTVPPQHYMLTEFAHTIAKALLARIEATK